IVYGGYKGIALDGFSVKSLNVLRNTLTKLPINFNIDDDYSALEDMSLDEIRSLTKKFCRDYLDIRDVMEIDLNKVNMDDIADSNTGEEFYDKVNAYLKPISPFDLHIKLAGGKPMDGRLHKPLIICPDELTCDNRKVYYDYIELNSKLNLLTVPAYVHEIGHAEVDQNIGYAEDFLHREVVSIFLEKVATFRLDKSGNLLKLCERIRLLYLMTLCKQLFLPARFVDEENRVKNLMYVKSILLAEKLFDIYISEIKEKNRDKYMDDINAIIDGKMTVEEMISKRRITIAQCQDYGLFLRHM
ncbi:MAG: hypothetical protein K2G03_00860, partial [Bacilli bacterium]|nr:hypothetical protein [Bacilli bacterium]